MPHLTSKEKTGYTVKEHKLRKILAKLNLEMTLEDSVNYDINNTPEEERVYRINRQRLTELIQGALGWVDRRTVYSMIQYLINDNCISHNPTSQLSSKKKIIMPTNNTKYLINKDIVKGKNCTHTPNSTLEKYIDSNRNL